MDEPRIVQCRDGPPNGDKKLVLRCTRGAVEAIRIGQAV